MKTYRNVENILHVNHTRLQEYLSRPKPQFENTTEFSNLFILFRDEQPQDIVFCRKTTLHEPLLCSLTTK